MDDLEIFKLCANKSLQEIKQMQDEELQRQAIRYYFSRLLADNTKDNPLCEDRNGSRLDILIETDEDCGLCDMQKLHVAGLSQTEGEGYINVLFTGCTEWNDIDILSNEQQLTILENLVL